MRALRKRRQRLQGAAVPHRHWVRRHEWRIFGVRTYADSIGRIESFRIVLG